MTTAGTTLGLLAALDIATGKVTAACKPDIANRNSPAFLRCGTFTSVRDLNAKIRTLVNGWNDRRCHSFVWPETAEEISKLGIA